MAPQDDDIWRLAAALLRKHGADALGEVERRLRHAKDEGDEGGRVMWHEVAKALHELTREPTADDKVN
jgi:hypothetical protein